MYTWQRTVTVYMYMYYVVSNSTFACVVVPFFVLLSCYNLNYLDTLLSMISKINDLLTHEIPWISHTACTRSI